MDSRLAKIIKLAEAGKLNTEIGQIVGLKKARVSQILKESGRHDLCGYARRSASGIASGGPRTWSKRTLPSQDDVRAAILYDPVAGTFHWRERPDQRRLVNSRFVGKVAGCLNVKHGYYEIRFNGVLYYGHQIAWIYANGCIPEGLEIDHKNRVRSCNVLSNLRAVTHAVNCENSPKRTPLYADVLPLP